MSRFERAMEKVPTNVIAIATFIVLASMVFIGGPIVTDTRDGVRASQRTDDLNGCRAQYRAAVDEANYEVLDAFGDVQSGISSATVAAIRQDPTTLALIAAELEESNARRRDALVVLLDAADAYKSAVQMSQSDPDGFLVRCQEDQ